MGMNLAHMDMYSLAPPPPKAPRAPRTPRPTSNEEDDSWMETLPKKKEE